MIIEGVPEAEVIEFKKEEITDKVAESISENGFQPGLFADLIRRAVKLLKRFLQVLVERTGESDREARADDVVTAVPASGPNRTPLPSSEKEEAEFARMKPIHERLRRSSRKVYAIGKNKENVQLALDSIPKGFLHRKDRRDLQNKIDELESEILSEENSTDFFVREHGYQCVRDAENAYWRAKHNLDQVQRAQDLWDGKPIRDEAERPSILKELRKGSAELNKEERMAVRSEKSL